MDVDPVGLGVGRPHGPDVVGAVVVTQRRRNATAAFWSIAAFTVILPGPKVEDSAQVPTVSASIGGDGKLIVPVPAGMGGGL